ncbi:MAG: Nif11-like leader peptide family natural product precursor [Leptolyngbya sp. SIO1E4]|nr:Nif11-like leader peptide family natural product precursor [Leptolyngbya sp. SIO1E4]
MSIKSVKDFIAALAEDESLQSDLAKALEAENDREAVTELAKSKGYDFTPEELWAEIERRQATGDRLTNNELSDAELEAVAGGGDARGPFAKEIKFIADKVTGRDTNVKW